MVAWNVDTFLTDFYIADNFLNLGVTYVKFNTLYVKFLLIFYSIISFISLPGIRWYSTLFCISILDTIISWRYIELMKSAIYFVILLLSFISITVKSWLKYLSQCKKNLESDPLNPYIYYRWSPAKYIFGLFLHLSIIIKANS